MVLSGTLHKVWRPTLLARVWPHHHLNVLTDHLFKMQFHMYTHAMERVGEGEREREGETPKQVPCCDHGGA